MTEKVLMKGNEAIAEAALRAGCRHFFGYPITPQTELAAYMARRMPKLGGTYLQAESEIAAVNMLYGAAAAGVRAMTSSSSPGISLKTEGISYMAGADLPGVIVNVQRGGPGLGSIQPSQSDYFQATRAMGHGDFYLPVLAPSTVQEMADLTYIAFDMADRYRTPVVILSDGMLGQMMEPVVMPDAVSLDALPPKPWAASGHEGVRKHNIINSLHLDAEKLYQDNLRRFRTYEEIERDEVRVETYRTEDADIVVCAFGAAARIVRSAVNAARERGIRVGLLRPITLWPYPVRAVQECRAQVFLVVELNMGQMIEDVRLAVEGAAPVSFFGRCGGVIPTPDEVLVEIERIAEGLGEQHD